MKEHTLIVSCGNIEFEQTYRSRDDPNDGVPIVQVVRAIKTLENICKAANLDDSGLLDMKIKVKDGC